MINNKYDDNFSSIPSTVIPLRTNKASVPIQNNGIIDLETHREETIMSNNTYSKNEIDLKFKNLETKIDSKFDLLMQKMDDGFEKQRLNTEKMLSDFKLNLVTDQQKNKKEFMYWAIGIIIALIGIAFPIWFGK
ncbi:Uncharacterised protein [Streptococcus pyogenes]|uniref:Uncharacterized protein n=2 Tax=Streptococcus pyogenes TaxID=1314 RepID=A0A8B6J1C3_STRPY|nr:orf73 [Streptococcus pyogenes]VGR84457.1 orf73 [Streptococcus pyogenes]VGS75877.1 orf73 [Streptococcus pyogenes]VGT85637.1 orf73 [Streptococcus pyogenes]VHA85252.1 Uncharacterised protein [Streptococcus pyogenes]